MKLLNLGCGQRFHKAWINIDFVSSNVNVIPHNLLNGIPYNENEFDVVYHSHVLEHFSKESGRKFIAECFGVLKPGGIIRIAVPDLEQIVRNYLRSMEGALEGDLESADNYEWMMLELYDQTVRNQSGGEMAKYFYKDEIKNSFFVFSRIGQEGKKIRENFMKSKKYSKKSDNIEQKYFLRHIFNPKFYLLKLKKIIFYKEMEELHRNKLYIAIGKFRLGGEIHQWMYDRYSLGKLLNDCGFSDIKVVTAFESRISSWNNYELESTDGVIHKPDSLFIEAIKK